MRNRLNIIKINGFGGMFIVALLIGCAIEGIIIFPSRILMYLWNYIAQYVNNMPAMTLMHGVILWAIVALSTYGILRGRTPISYHSPNIVSEDELKEILKNAKNIENLNSIIKEENSEHEMKH